MGNISTSLQAHYTQGSLLDRIVTALKAAGHDTHQLSPDILGPIEHLHTGGLGFTKEQAEKAGFTSGMKVLDLGCGIGGPARYIASSYDCEVVGLDLTAEFIDVADELTKRCDMAATVRFQQGNALDLPFADESFDVVFCQNLSMNIEDKSGLFREAHRVLRSGGTFTSTDHTQGPGGEPYYPTGWANSADISFLVPPEDMRRLLEHAGFRVREWIDGSSKVLDLARKARETAGSSEPSPLGLQVVLGDDYPERQKNLQRSLQENRLVYVMVFAEKT